VFNKLKAFYYYNKAIKSASELNFFDALNYLYKTPVNVKTLYFYILQGYLLESIGKFEESLISYDNARFKIVSDKKTNDEKPMTMKKNIYENILIMAMLVFTKLPVITMTQKNFYQGLIRELST